MEFCPKCGSALRYKKEDGNTLKYCKRDDFKEEVKVDSSKNSEKSIGVEVRRIDKIEVIEGKKTDLEIYKIDCRKCHKTEANLVGIIKASQLSDEQDIFVFKCVNCGNITRHNTAR